MKIRTGFVSNSSSSSFICKTKMPPYKVEMILRRMVDVYHDRNKDQLIYENETYETMFEKPFYGSKAYDEALDDYISFYKRTDMTTKGKLIIESVGDNSIPSELFEPIERAFNGTRIHLG